MQCNVGCSSNDTIRSNTRDVLVGTVVDSNIGIVGLRECTNFEVVSVGSVGSHSLQIVLEILIDLLQGDLGGVERGRSNVLSLWIATATTSKLDRNEVLEVIGVLPHELNHVCPNVAAVALVTKALVAESVEQAITWQKNIC